jgi:hypothetical protein
MVDSKAFLEDGMERMDGGTTVERYNNPDCIFI